MCELFYVQLWVLSPSGVLVQQVAVFDAYSPDLVCLSLGKLELLP